VQAEMRVRIAGAEIALRCVNSGKLRIPHPGA